MALQDPSTMKRGSIPHPIQPTTHSSRSSAESPHTPSSPFLHNLSNRFRKSSNASNLSVHSDPPSQPPDPADRAETAQSAKRFLLSVLRNDWEWPPPQIPTMSGGESNTLSEQKQDSLLNQREPATWRTRQEGISDLDIDLSPMSVGGRRSTRDSDPYRFESPDAIGDMLEQKKLKRKRAAVEEAKWNEGLRVWMERRDAWTAAEHHRPRPRPSIESEASLRASGMHMRHKSSLSSEETKHSPSTPDSMTATAIVSEKEGAPNWPLPAATNGIESTQIADQDDLHGPYLPIYPPLFPTSHTLRSRIKPAAYPTIYSKVVLQSLSPNVPIPLSHMIGALVDGWKAEGNWPPQTLAEQQQQALLKRAKGAKKGDSAFQKWRREREAEQKQSNTFNHDFGEELVDDAEEKRGFRKSLSGAVKKVFGIHGQEDEDGGLARLGLEFAEGSADEYGLMKESAQVAADNVLLNKALLEGEKG